MRPRRGQDEAKTRPRYDRDEIEKKPRLRLSYHVETLDQDQEIIVETYRDSTLGTYNTKEK